MRLPLFSPLGLLDRRTSENQEICRSLQITQAVQAKGGTEHFDCLHRGVQPLRHRLRLLCLGVQRFVPL